MDILNTLWSRVFGSPYGIGQVLFRATPLILCALGASVSFRSGLFNIGLEGQLLVGSLCGALAANALGAVNAWIGLPLVFICAFLGGSFFALVGGYLKAKRNVHEVVSTMMLNFVAIGLTNFVTKIFAVPETTHTPEITPHLWAPRLSSALGIFQGSAVSILLFFALGLALLIFYVVYQTRFGLETKAMGHSSTVASYSDIDTDKRIFQVMALSGGLAAWAGLNFVLGYKHYFEMNFSSGVGFLAIAVSLIAGNHPLIIIPVALFFALLEETALAVNIHVPKEAVQVLEAGILMGLLFAVAKKSRLKAA